MGGATGEMADMLLCAPYIEIIIPKLGLRARHMLAVTAVEQWDAVESARERGMCVTWLRARHGPKPSYPTAMSFKLEELEASHAAPATFLFTARFLFKRHSTKWVPYS